MTLSFCWDGYLWTRYLFQSMKLVGSALGMVRTTLKNPTCLHVWKYGGSTSYFMYAAKESGKKKEMRSCSVKVEKTFASSKTHFPNHMFVTAMFSFGNILEVRKRNGATTTPCAEGFVFGTTLLKTLGNIPTNISKHPRLVGFITGIPAKIRVWKLRGSMVVWCGIFFLGKNDVRRKTWDWIYRYCRWNGEVLTQRMVR